MPKVNTRKCDGVLRDLDEAERAATKENATLTETADRRHDALVTVCRRLRKRLSHAMEHGAPMPVGEREQAEAAYLEAKRQLALAAVHGGVARQIGKALGQGAPEKA